MANDTIKGLLLATRPKTLWAGVCPVMVGTALAQSLGKLHWPSAVVCLFAAVFMQIGTNYANDYYDCIKGTDTAERIGPMRATQAGLVKPRTMMIAFMLMYGLTAVCTAYLAYRSHWALWIVLAASVASGILYTAGPFPLGYNGLGDLFAFIFFGPVACAGTYFVQGLDLNVAAVIAGIAPGCFSVAMIDVNNTRDIEQDRKAGKRTLAVIFGRKFACFEYWIAFLGAVVVPVVLWRLGFGTKWQLASMVVLLPGIWATMQLVKHRDGPSLNRILAVTGVLLLLHSILFSIGLIL